MATIGSIVGGAFNVVKQRPAAVAIWGLIYIVGSLVISLVAGLITGMGFVMPGQSDPEAFLQANAGSFVLSGFVTGLLYLLLSIVLINAVYRAILRPHDSGFASLRLGGDEFRMLGLTILFFIGLFVLYLLTFLGMILLVFLAGLIAGNSPIAAGIVGALVGIGFLCLWVWLCVRLSLIFPMTFHRRRFAVDEGWALGRGRFWTLFGSYFLVWLIVFVAMILFFGSTFGALFALIGQRGDPAATQAALQQLSQSQAAAGIAGFLFAAIGGMVIALLSFVLGYVVVGSAARELLAEQGDVTEEDAYRTAEIFE